MGLSDFAVDELTERHVAELLSSGVPEGIRIDYKRDPYGSTDADKKEFLKDISSFANSAGGHLVIGVAEKEGTPTEICPFSIDPDAELQRLENLLRDSVEPRISGIVMTAIPVAAGGHAIVVRVPKSWNAPHRVAFKGSSRFYGRTSAGAYEFSVDELKSKFLSAASAHDRALTFRAQRLALISSNDGVVPLAQDDGRLVIHIVPLGSQGETSVDLTIAMDHSGEFAPPGAGGWSPEFNFDGFANIRSGESVFGYTQLFRDGSIEATKVRVVTSKDGIRRIPAFSVCDPIVKSVPKYLHQLQRLSISAPLLVMISLEGVSGAYLGYSQHQWMDESPAIRRDRLELPPVLIPEYSDTTAYQRALKPAFDALWNAGGLPECTYYDGAGNWNPTA